MRVKIKGYWVSLMLGLVLGAMFTLLLVERQRPRPEGIWWTVCPMPSYIKILQEYDENIARGNSGDGGIVKKLSRRVTSGTK